MTQNDGNQRPLRNLEIGSRKRALEIFRGTLPPQRSARKDDCLSAKREFRLCSDSVEAQGRKMSSARRDLDFQSLNQCREKKPCRVTYCWKSRI